MDSIKFNTYIKRILKVNSNELSISGRSVNQLSDLLNVLTHLLVQEATTSAKSGSTIDLKHVEYAVKVVFPDSLKDGTLSAIHTSVDKFKNAPKNVRSKAARAGLYIPPASIRRLFNTHNRKTKLVSIGIAAALEYIVGEILTLSTNYTIEKKKNRITSRAIMFSVMDDLRLKTLITGTLGFSFSGAGEVPHIHQNLLPAKGKKRNTSSKRTIPGSVALKEMRKLQKSDDLLIQKEPIRRLTKAFVAEGAKVSNVALEAIHSYIEKFAVDVLKRAQLDAFHAKRVRVSSKDIQKAETCEKPEYLSISADLDSFTSEFKKGGITRLARRAGVKTMSSDAVVEMAKLLVMELYVLIGNADSHRVLGGRATLSIKDVHAAEKRRGKIVSTGIEMKKKKKAIRQNREKVLEI